MIVLRYKLTLPMLGMLLLSTACYENVSRPEDCDARFSSEATGVWTLKGDGLRSECKDPDFNGDLTLEMKPFSVKGTPIESDGTETVPVSDSEADAFVERIRHVRYRLEVDGSPRFKFEGASDTCSVDFTIREELKRGDYHAYDFNGYVTYSGYIEGNFTGEGPSGCKTEGHFEIEVD